MKIRNKDKKDEDINKELETSELEDFDFKKAVFINKRWNLEKSYPLNIRINKAILAEAKLVAKEKGIPYQTLLKIYIADGIRNDLKIINE